MSITDDTFFTENIDNINKMVAKVLITMKFVPLLFIFFSYKGMFEISHTFSLIMFIYSVIVSVIVNTLINLRKFPKFTMYFGLISIQLFVALLGSNRNVGVYITFGLVPILSSLYYNKKLSNIIGIMSYFAMLISLYFKYLNGAALFDFEHHSAFSETYIPIVAGLTVEFLFIFLTINLIARRNYSTLRHLIALIDDRNGFVQKLRESKDDFERKNSELQDTQFKIIKFIAKCLGSHDLFTGSHVIHTRSYVEMIAKKLKENGYYKDILTEENIKLYSSAAFIHDIGKIHVPEGILNKMGKFTVDEFEMMKSHTTEGKKLLEILPPIEDGLFNKIAIDMAYCHHEKWDGTGYPRRIAGKEIPLCARIMTAADVLDALISKRLYKEPMSIEQAMRVFFDSRGSHFEPCIADAVIQLKDEIEVIDAEFKKKEAAVYKKEFEWWDRYHKMLENQKKEESEQNEQTSKENKA